MGFPTNKGISNGRIILFVLSVFLLIILLIYGAQHFFDRDIEVLSNGLLDRKTEYEINKLGAEISQIRSDTAGSLFWLKLIALFVTVGGAVGGYLVGQSINTQAKLNFENKKNVDEVYQTMVRELADDSAILRASAAVKLGSILKSFPSEWDVSDERKEELYQLTKQVLAAALSIEKDPKVLKTLSISLILHKPDSLDGRASVQEMDLSGALAEDAYWARCDFEYADFYAANLSRTSFRKSNLKGVQFRESNLTNAVFAESDCVNTNFKMADLRGASFEKATLKSVNFEKAKVFGVSLAEAQLDKIIDCQVDISEHGDGSQLISVIKWLEATNG